MTVSQRRKRLMQLSAEEFYTAIISGEVSREDYVKITYYLKLQDERKIRGLQEELRIEQKRSLRIIAGYEAKTRAVKPLVAPSTDTGISALECMAITLAVAALSGD